MPKSLLLDEFGSRIWSAFGEPPYLVGSALEKKDGWRDVDVRLILDDEEYARWGFGDPKCPHSNDRWRSFCIAFSLLGKEMTGLPIDFQIQQRTLANEQFQASRSAIGLIPSRQR